MVRAYFYNLLTRYLRLHIREGDQAVELDPLSDELLERLAGCRRMSMDDFVKLNDPDHIDYVIINGGLHYQPDVQEYLRKLRGVISDKTRLIVATYSSFWRPLITLASWLGLRRKTLESNWLDDGDIENFLRLTDFELVRRDARVLLPVNVPLLAPLVNRYLAPLPGFRMFALVNLFIVRPRAESPSVAPSVSIIVPARNESGNIEQIIQRIPTMGPADEIVFVEGGSSDDTWEKIQQTIPKYPDRRIQATQQDGKGKGNAVRKGFSIARNEILMILDADLTVPPEDLPKFYEAIATGKAEFINGSRLVYPMETGAMRFLNLLGNKFFASAFSFVLGQRFKDTLCGTKVISQENYRRLAAHRSYFGEFDPFGDFDLIFGAVRMGLRVIEVPIRYRERTYGSTNISRWRHGALLFAMLIFSSRRLKFI